MKYCKVCGGKIVKEFVSDYDPNPILRTTPGHYEYYCKECGLKYHRSVEE